MKVDPIGIFYMFVAAVTLALLVVVFVPVFACACSSASPKTASWSNIKQLATAGMIYSADYDNRLPVADRWGTDLEPYTKNPQLFNDHLIRPKKFGFAFFEPVEVADVEAIENPAEVPLAFQSLILDLNAHSDLRSLPLIPRVDGKWDLYSHVDASAKPRERAWALKRVVIQRKKP